MTESSAGFTLIESLVVLVALAVLTTMVAESIVGLSRTQAHQNGQVRVDELCNRVVQQIETDAEFAVTVFARNVSGLGYLGRMKLPDEGILAGSRLPTITDRGYFERDTKKLGDTGNQLFFARRLDGVDIDLGFGDVIRLDTFEFVLYYVVELEDGTLDVVNWRSEPLVSEPDIAGIEDPSRRQETLEKLFEAGVVYAWDRDRPRAVKLSRILEGGWLEPFSNSAKVRAREISAPILHVRHMSLATNDTPRANVPSFAKPASDRPFPAGFETRIDGDDDAKLVLVRLVVIGPRNTSTTAEATQVVTVRES